MRLWRSRISRALPQPLKEARRHANIRTVKMDLNQDFARKEKVAGKRKIYVTLLECNTHGESTLWEIFACLKTLMTMQGNQSQLLILGPCWHLGLAKWLHSSIRFDKTTPRRKLNKWQDGVHQEIANSRSSMSRETENSTLLSIDGWRHSNIEFGQPFLSSVSLPWVIDREKPRIGKIQRYERSLACWRLETSIQ